MQAHRSTWPLILNLLEFGLPFDLFDGFRLALINLTARRAFISKPLPLVVARCRQYLDKFIQLGLFCLLCFSFHTLTLGIANPSRDTQRRSFLDGMDTEEHTFTSINSQHKHYLELGPLLRI
jgi:hypothetical protein